MWFCDWCGGEYLYEDLIYMNTIEKYADSTRVFCKKCFNNNKILCEKCHKNVSGYTCQNNNCDVCCECVCSCCY